MATALECVFEPGLELAELPLTYEMKCQPLNKGYTQLWGAFTFDIINYVLACAVCGGILCFAHMKRAPIIVQWRRICYASSNSILDRSSALLAASGRHFEATHGTMFPQVCPTSMLIGRRGML